MQIILKNDNYYFAIDCETSRWSDSAYSIEQAIANIQNLSFKNTAITNCTSETEILKELQDYPSYTLIEFIDDKDTPYEYW